MQRTHLEAWSEQNIQASTWKARSEEVGPQTRVEWVGSLWLQRTTVWTFYKRTWTEEQKPLWPGSPACLWAQQSISKATWSQIWPFPPQRVVSGSLVGFGCWILAGSKKLCGLQTMFCRHPCRKGCCVQVAVRVGQVSRAPHPPGFMCWCGTHVGPLLR